MNRIVGNLICSALLALIPSLLAAQVTSNSSAAAKSVSKSSGTPSTLSIQANILALQRAEIQRDIVEANRCIRNASQSQTLRDPQGNINQVPQNDIIDCTRWLKQLQRRLNSILVQTQQLTKEADFRSAQLERAARAAERREIRRAISGK